MQFVVHPLFVEWYRFLPSKLSKEMLDNLDINKKKWQKVIEEEQERQMAQENAQEVENSSTEEEDNDDLDDEMSDTVEEARLPLNFTHLIDNDEENTLVSKGRRASCQTPPSLKEIRENGWDPEQRRHSMPPAYLRREITCVTIRRNSLPMNQIRRRSSLPTAVILHATSLDKLSGKFSNFSSTRYSSGEKSLSMEELLSRPKISNLTLSYETSRLASGLSDISHHRSQGNTFKFRSVPETKSYSDRSEDSRTLDL